MNSQKFFGNLSVEKISMPKHDEKSMSFLLTKDVPCTKNSEKGTPATESRSKNIILQVSENSTQKKKKANKVVSPTNTPLICL